MVFIPVLPNWRGGVRDTYEFLSEIHSSKSGKEQRRALRIQPRRQISFNTILTGNRAQRVLDAMVRARNGMATMMDPTARKALLASPAATNATSITVQTPPPDWLEAGAKFAVYDQNRVEMRQATSITGGNQVNFSVGLEGAFPSGAKVTSVLPIVLRERADFAAVTDEDYTHEVTVDVLPGTQLRVPAELDPVEDFDTPGIHSLDGVFYGRFVMLRKPNFVSAPRIQHVSAHERVDYSRGVISTFRHINYAQRLFAAQYLGRTYNDTEYLLDTFLRNKGQVGELMMPTWGNDLPDPQSIGNAGQTLLFAGGDLLDAYADDISYRNILIRLTDGRIFPRQIVTMGAESGSTRLDLDAALPGDVTTANIESIAWLFVCRFASDSLTVEWVTDEVAQFQMNFASLESLPVETLYGSNWILKTGQWRDVGQWEDGAAWRDTP